MDLGILDRLVATMAVVANNVKARHWTVYGKRYNSWHPRLDEIYELLSDSVDNVAELIVQRGGIPVHSLIGYIEKSEVQDMLPLGDADKYIADTGVELKCIIDYINRYEEMGVWDGAASNDLTGIASKLYHYYMFCEQTLKSNPYGEE